MVRDEYENGLKDEGVAPVKREVELGEPAEFRGDIGPLRVHNVDNDPIQILRNVTLE